MRRNYPDGTLAIVAGGEGRRLGAGPKGLLRLDGQPLVQRLASLGEQFHEVLLISNRPEPYQAFGLRSEADVLAGRGAPGGVHAALVHARTPWVAVVACDMPFVIGEVLRALLEARTDELDAIYFEAQHRPQPFPAVYRSSVGERWGNMLSTSPSFRELWTGLRTRALTEQVLRAADPTGRAVMSVNTEDDARRWGIELPR